MNKNELKNKIKILKEELGSKIVIPVHHYQSPDIVEYNDFVGDSYKLAVECSKADAEYIIFCGVLFMAEGASILAKDYQKVLLPESTAGCPMADMADLPHVEKVFNKLSGECKNEIAPVLYINSYADLKNFCGKKGGSTCTSSNAPKIIDHFFKQGKSIFFFPDYYLGKNTAVQMGIEDKYIVKVKKDLSIETTGTIENAKVFLWDGFCPIHQRFKQTDIKYLREKYPDIKIIVHPESMEEVVNAADYSGSTQKIFNMINDSPAGSIWGVGTETTFVGRLASNYPDKTIVPLRESRCKNMNKLTLNHLYESLISVKENMSSNGKLKYEIKVNDEYKENAKKALKMMINIVESN